MSLIRPRYCLAFALTFIFNLPSPLQAQSFKDVVASGKWSTKGKWNINDWNDTRASYSTAASANPILEVLYAWVGIDDPEHWHPDALVDITQKMKEVLADGRILITKNAMLSMPLTGSNDFAPGKYKAWGIVYRDTDGVHFRRGPLNTGISLPAITSHYNDKNERGWGGYFLSHQLEETDRGLVTYSCQAPNEHHVNLSAINYIGRWADYDHYHHTDHWILQFVAGGWGGSRSILRRANAAFWDYNHTHQGDRGGNGNLVPYIHSGSETLRYDPWANQNKPFWFAYDHGYFRWGEGTPTNEDELSGQEVEYPGEVPATPPTLWMRYFGLRGPGNYTNIKSRFLNPAKKLRTPAYLRGRFPFWRDVWKTETPGSFSLKFKGRGKKIYVGLHDVNPIATGSGTSDLNNSNLMYRLEAREGQTIIYNKGTEVCNTSKSYNDEKQKVYGRKGTGGGSVSTYYDYWLTIDGNVLTFGHGTVIGENKICQYNEVGSNDDGRKATYFSFSSHDDESDYIDITHATYSTPYILEATNGQFTGWNERWKLPEESRGGITFKARNLSGSDKTIALGLNSTLPGSPNSGATYSISWGDLANSASLIKKLGAPVDQKQHTVPTDPTEWGEYWVKYSDGNISYGTGSELDKGILGSWYDEAASQGMQYFGFGTANNSVEISGVRTHFIAAHNSYDANPPGQGIYKQWLSSWSLTNDNQGALSFDVYTQEGSLDVTLKIGFTVAGDDTPGGATYDLLIGKKEGNTHKVVLNKLGVEKASATLTGYGIPHSAGRSYWVIWYNDRIFVGAGGKIGDLNNLILSYDTSSDPSATTAINIRRFSFTSNTGIVSYRNIKSHPFSLAKNIIDEQEQATEDEAGTIESWRADRTQRTIGANYARRLYWHPEHNFAKDEARTSLSFTVKKPIFAEKAMPLIALGTQPAPTTPDGTKTLMAKEDYAGASYVIGLKPDGALVLLKRNGDNLNAITTSPVHEKIKALNNGQSHTVWLNFDEGSFKLGIDSSLGVDPIWEYTDPAPLNTVRYFSFGTGGNAPAADYVVGSAVAPGQAGKIELSAITIRDHYDPTQYLTPSAERALHYEWRSDWKLPYPNNGGVTFTLKPHGTSTNNVMGTIGFGPDTLPVNQAGSYAGALYNVLFFANSRVQVTKQGYDTTTLDAKTRSVPKVKAALTDGKAHNWWVMFANRTIMLGIDTAPGTEPIWSWSDPVKQNEEPNEELRKNVQHFSFSSASGQLLLTNIMVPQQEAAKSLSNEMLNFEDILMTNPNQLFMRLDQLMTEQVHKQNLSGFIGTLSMIGRARELIPDREPLSKIIMFTLEEPGLDDSQKSILRDAKALLASTPTLEELTDQYTQDFKALSIETLEHTDPVRKLFMHKLARLADRSKVKSAELHIAIDPFDRENTDKLGTLLQALSPELITDEPEKILEDVRFSDEEKQTLLALAKRIQGEREALWSATTAYRLEKIKEMSGISYRLTNIRTLIEAKRNDTEDKIEFTDADYLALTQLLRTTVENRWQLPKVRLLYLTKTLNAARLMAGISDNQARRESIQELLDEMQKELSFQERLERAQVLLDTYEAAPSTNPGRMDFFKEALPRIFDGNIVVESGKGINEVLQPFVTTILLPLRSGPLSEQEEKDLIKAVQTMERVKSEFNQFSARIARAEEKSETIFDYSQALLRILSDKDEVITFTEEDHNTFVSKLYEVVMNRELLSPGHLPTVEILFERATFTVGFDGTKEYMVGFDSGEKMTLPAMKEKVLEPYSFGDRVAHTVAFTNKLITRNAIKDEEGTVISDALSRRMVAKLRIIKDAPNESSSGETEELFQKLQNRVFMPLLSSNRIAEDDRSQLKDIHSMIKTEKDSIIAAQKTFKYNFDSAQKKKGNLGLYVKELSRIMSGIQRKTITFVDEDVEVIRNEVLQLLAIRDELKTTFDMRQIIRNMKYSRLKELIPELEETGEDELNEFERALLPENAFPYAELVTKYEREARDVPHLPINDGIEDEDDAEEQLRTRFFDKLSNLSRAPGDRTLSSLQTHLRMLETLSDAPLETHELELVELQKGRIQKEIEQQDTARFRLITADKYSTTFFDYARALNEILRDKVKLTNTDCRNFDRAIKYLVGNREVLDGDQRSFVRSMLDGILNQFEDVQGNPLKEEYAPDLFATGFGLHATGLFKTRARLATAHTLSNRISYSTSEIASFEKNSQSPEHARFERFMEKMAVLLKAPGIKAPTEFEDLEKLYNSLKEYMTANKADTTTVETWLKKLPEEKERILKEQQSFSYQFQQAEDQLERGGNGPYIAELKAIAQRKQDFEVTFKTSDFLTFYDALNHLVKQRDALSRTEWMLLQSACAITDTNSFAPNEQLRADFAKLHETVNELPDFNTKVQEYLKELDDIKGASTKSEERATYFKKLSNVSRLPGFKDVARIDDLVSIANQLMPRVATPTEKQTLETLIMVIMKEKVIASTLPYHLARLEKEVKQAREEGRDHVDQLIRSLNGIITQKRQGDIVFTDQDPQRLVTLCDRMLNKREMFTPEQIEDIQNICGDLQIMNGFEAYDMALENIKKKIGEPQTLETRLKKYERARSYVDGLILKEPMNVAKKEEFVNMVSTIMEAPGDRSENMLERLARLVKNIRRGNFTEGQKDSLIDLDDKISQEGKKLNSFEHRIDGIKQSPTPTEYHNSLEELINGVALDKITMTPVDQRTLVQLLKDEAKKRPLIANVSHSLFVVINAAKATPALASETTLSDLETIEADLRTDASLVNRVQDMRRLFPIILRKEKSDGERRRFFVELETFTENLALLPGERLTLDKKESMSEAIRQIAPNEKSGLATASEKELIKNAVAQLSATNKRIDVEEAKREAAKAKAEEERLAAEKIEAEKAKREADIKRQEAEKAIRRQRAINAAKTKTNLAGRQRSRVSRRRSRAPVRV